VDPARLNPPIRVKDRHLTRQFHISHFAALAVEYGCSSSLCIEEVGSVRRVANIRRDWPAFALLLIDVQQDFWSGQTPEHFPDFPANVKRLLTLCRAEGIEVVHLRASYKPDRSDWMARYKLLGRIPCVEGTPGVETLPFAIEEPGEALFIKRTFDGFHSPELLPHLRAAGKRFLLTAGLLTSVCVFLTTASAAQLGFLTAIVEDCCADEPFAHEHTLDRYQFIFERTQVDLIREQHPQWLAALKELDAG
jgi:nicotinamidase-related amidase